jgi:hypothetical protein
MLYAFGSFREEHVEFSVLRIEQHQNRGFLQMRLLQLLPTKSLKKRRYVFNSDGHLFATTIFPDAMSESSTSTKVAHSTE